MAIAAGTCFNHYQIIAQLGSGGMGEVYRARDQRLGRDVAIKVLPTEFSRDADRLRRFEQEARAVGMLNHPNILTIYEIGNAAAENGGGPFIWSSFGHIAVSPDGRHLAFTAATGGKVQLWVRALDSTEARALAGTQGATFPFWSPESHFVGFFADGRLKKIEVTGGPVQTLYEASLPLGGAWSRDGVILFGPQPVAGLLRISATGGEVTQVTMRYSSPFLRLYCC